MAGADLPMHSDLVRQQAIHELGHAVVAHRLGFRLEYTGIRCGENGSVEWITTFPQPATISLVRSGKERLDGHMADRYFAMVWLAGPIAEELLLPPSGVGTLPDVDRLL